MRVPPSTGGRSVSSIYGKREAIALEIKCHSSSRRETFFGNRLKMVRSPFFTKRNTLYRIRNFWKIKWSWRTSPSDHILQKSKYFVARWMAHNLQGDLASADYRMSNTYACPYFIVRQKRVKKRWIACICGYPHWLSDWVMLCSYCSNEINRLSDSELTLRSALTLLSSSTVCAMPMRSNACIHTNSIAHDHIIGDS